MSVPGTRSWTASEILPYSDAIFMVISGLTDPATTRITPFCELVRSANPISKVTRRAA